MKKIILVLIIAFVAIATTSAQKPSKANAKANANVPTNVIERFDYMINMYGQKDRQQYSVVKNPNTGQIESREKITHFVGADEDDADFVRMAFTRDEPVSYQFFHLVPGSTDRFSISVVNNSANQKTINLRTSKNQEMWYMAVKNPENPQLRDVYAVTWEKKNGKLEGDIYMISSLRPDIYQQNLESSSKTFKIEGRIDGEIKDSLYNVYIADSYAELNALGDDDYVACVPIINKRFEYSVELDKPKAGRIRCIFPDGSLCSAWINLDFVPGETYRITVHNGYFDEDRDFEQRVGRYSGKSLVVGYDNDDGTSQMVIDENGNAVSVDEWKQAQQVSDPLANLNITEAQKMDLQLKAQNVQNRMDLIKALYKTTDEHTNMLVITSGAPKDWPPLDTFFKQITEQNKELDKQTDEVLQLIKKYGVPANTIMELHKELLEFYTEQTMGITGFYTRYGSLSTAAQKCQKQVNSLVTKHIKAMSEPIK